MTERETRELIPSEKFFRYFQHEVTDLQESMKHLETRGTSGGERQDAIDHCLAGIARLSNEVKDASSYLPAYDQRTYGEAIKALTTKLQDVRASLEPRPKFTFKHGTTFSAKKNASAISLTDAAELADEKKKNLPGYVSDRSGNSSFTPTPQNSHSPIEGGANGSNVHGLDRRPAQQRLPSFSHSVAVNNYEDQHIMVPLSAGQGSSPASLSNLRRCVVNLSGPSTRGGRPFATLTLRGISDSLVICGHVAGPVHLTDITNSVIVVASRQFRMHESTNCDIYLSTSSRPIIEDCSGLRFASLPEKFSTEADKANTHQWRQVDDFKWLKHEPSPNWRELTHPVPASVWSQVASEDSYMSIGDTLKAVRESG